MTADDVALARREGYEGAEHLKRYTTLGMATDQGKTANVAGLAVMAEITGRTIPGVGTTVFRPPYTPVSLGALAGHRRGKEFRPSRLPPSHAWAAEQGAVFTEAGLWIRAQYFPRAGETHWRASVDREVRTVRSAVGVCDVSTLGKIDIQGPDAAALLDRVYVNMISSLAIGKVRYAVMLREDGFVMDDGTVCRLSAEHFLVTTTTANAAKVLEHLDFCHQVLWPGLDVAIVPVTDQWAQFSIAGPRARDVLQKTIDSGADISNAHLPYMGATEVAVGGVACRLFRVSFSGEQAYEIAVGAEYGDALMRALMAAGAEFGIAPYGTEALGVMRIEKGHAGGPELDGRTTLHDLGLAKMASRKKDFIGRIMAERPALTDADRQNSHRAEAGRPERDAVRRGAPAGAGEPSNGRARRGSRDLGRPLAHACARRRVSLAARRRRSHRRAHPRRRSVARPRRRMHRRRSRFYRSGRSEIAWLGAGSSLGPHSRPSCGRGALARVMDRRASP